jgi:phenylacetate-CoA ligase
MDLNSAQSLFPLITPEGLAGYHRILEHPDAPRFTHQIGDHATSEDLKAVDEFRDRTIDADPGFPESPPDAILGWAARVADQVPLYRDRIPSGINWERDFTKLPTLSRQDFATHMVQLIPDDEPYERLIVYDTSGTTGHALRIPTHPRAVAISHVLAERALGWFGHCVSMGPAHVACMNLHAQASIWSYASVFSVWKQAGFARLNFHPSYWSRGEEQARGFIRSLNPGFLCGTPASLAAMLTWQIEAHPQVLLCTATSLGRQLKQQLERHYTCPVLDWYSTTETGPIACSSPGSEGLARVAPDLYVELLDPEGQSVTDGVRGEITVTGGRNPFLPLLRYRTGDFAKLATCPTTNIRCLFELEGRQNVLFFAADGSPINSVDIGRVLRNNFAVVQHQFLQRSDGSCLITLCPAPGANIDCAQLEHLLSELFLTATPITIELRQQPPNGEKWIPYRSEHS